MKRVVKYFILACLVFGFYPTQAGANHLSSDSLHLRFAAFFGKSPLLLNHTSYDLNDSMQITFGTFRFYVSGIRLKQDEKEVYSNNLFYQLVDLSKPSTQELKLSIPDGLKYNRIIFNVGVDSVTNVSGVMEGDLDPLNGMYWTWQSGYIYLKLEGSFHTPHVKNEPFQFHIGGYRTPYNALVNVACKLEEDIPLSEVTIPVDIRSLLKDWDLSKQHLIMSPSASAVSFADLFAHCFKIMTP